MPVFVIDPFKAVQIQRKYRQGSALACRSGDLNLAPFHDVATIEGVRRRIENRHVVEIPGKILAEAVDLVLLVDHVQIEDQYQSEQSPNGAAQEKGVQAACARQQCRKRK